MKASDRAAWDFVAYIASLNENFEERRKVTLGQLISRANHVQNVARDEIIDEAQEDTSTLGGGAQ